MRFAYATGTRPLDGYTIKRGVGVGGFGEVYFAVSDAGKEVAIKRIQRNLDVEIRGVSQCLNLKHPNLVAIFDIRYDDEGQAWVVMEYVRGECLKDVIERNPHGMPFAETLDWFRGIAAGCGYLHDHGIVHRDLKPGNVFLDEAVVKIGDYGLSKYISCSRRSGQTESVGTFHYMAPEIGRGVYGREIDVYALGIMLYEMLSGRVPFEGETSHEIIMKHLTAIPDVSPLPESIRPVVQRALFKDPEKRYRTVQEFAAAVESALGGAAPVRSLLATHAATTAQAARPQHAAHHAATSDSASDGMYFGPVRQRAEATPATPVVVSGGASGEEPIARAVRGSWAELVRWWKGPQLTQPARVALIGALVVLTIVNGGWLFPIALMLGSMYLVYFGIRAVVLALTESSTPVSMPAATRVAAPMRHPPVSDPIAAVPIAYPAATYPAATQPARPQPARKRRRWHELACDRLRHKPAAERLMELTGSMLMAAIVTGIASLLLLVVAGFQIDGSVAFWTRYSWLTLTCVLGVWSLLLSAKFSEGYEGDAVRQRLAQLVIGLVVGTAAFELHQFLGANLANQRLLDLPQTWRPPGHLFAADGTPMYAACLVYFAGLFLLPRWTRQADPLRSARFGLWTTAGTVFLAVIWQIFWPFPQPWGLMVATCMSIALQLSAPWISNGTRQDLKRLAEAS